MFPQSTSCRALFAGTLSPVHSGFVAVAVNCVVVVLLLCCCSCYVLFYVVVLVGVANDVPVPRLS